MTLLVGLPPVHSNIPFRRPSHKISSFAQRPNFLIHLNLYKKVLRKTVRAKCSGLQKKYPLNQNVRQSPVLPDETETVLGGGGISTIGSIHNEIMNA